MPRYAILVFLFLTAAVLGLVNWHALRWLTRAFHLSTRVRRVLSWVLAGSLLGMVLGRVAGGVWSGAPVTWLLWFSGTVQLGVLMAVALLLPADVVRLVACVARRLQKPEAAAAHQGDAVPRRAVLTQVAAGAAFLTGGSSSLYGALVGRHDYQLDEHPVRIPGLSPALDGFTIVQLSDVHIGAFVGGPELRAAEDLIRKARPDLLVLTGDLLDHDEALAEQLGIFVRRLQPIARAGLVAISGNHDFYAGIGPVVRAVERGGGTVLRNQGRIIGSGAAAFALLGVDDVWARRTGGGPDLPRAIASLPEHEGSVARARDLPRILLCHNPSYFEESAGQVALQLSGHTHGGQVQLVVNPAEWFVKRGWVRGSYHYKGSELYVNRGFGTVGPPARVGSPPEITRVVLTA